MLVFTRIDHQRNSDTGERQKDANKIEKKNHFERDCFPQLVFFHRSRLLITNKIMERPKPSGVQWMKLL